MKKLAFLALLVTLLVGCALAQNALELTAEPYAVHYSITVPGEAFLKLIYEAPEEKGQMVIYSDSGVFAGTIPLDCSGAGGTVTVKLQNLKLKDVARHWVKLPAAPDYAAPVGQADAKVSGLTLEETPAGFRYSFIAPGADYMLLDCHSRQEDRTFPVYPIDDEGHFAGEVVMPLTYARTQMTITVRNGRGSARKEEVCYKGYEAPAVEANTAGRLSGVVVCIDPGHQEISRIVTEPVGPGLSGTVTTTPGMAMGTHTLRRESIVALEISIALRDVLVQQGATVVLTRDRQDVYVSNLDRCAIAAEAGAHVMLRLHCDYVDDVNRQGIAIYSPRNSDYAQAVADEETYEKMAQTLLDCTKTAVGYDLHDGTGRVRLNDAYVGNNWAQMACFLIEMGYMTNIREDLLLSHPVYQQWLAEGMAEGVYQLALMQGWLAE